MCCVWRALHKLHNLLNQLPSNKQSLDDFCSNITDYNYMICEAPKNLQLCHLVRLFELMCKHNNLLNYASFFFIFLYF